MIIRSRAGTLADDDPPDLGQDLLDGRALRSSNAISELLNRLAHRTSLESWHADAIPEFDAAIEPDCRNARLGCQKEGNSGRRWYARATGSIWGLTNDSRGVVASGSHRAKEARRIKRFYS